MSFTKEDWGDNLIDTRDIINRYEELKDDRECYLSDSELAVEELRDYDGEDPEVINDLALDVANYKKDLETFEEEYSEELEFLEEVVRQGEGYSGWGSDALIEEDYFTEYTKQLINDCHEMPEEFDKGTWPWNHMEMDWEGAADSLKVDYGTIEINNFTYYITA